YRRQTRGGSKLRHAAPHEPSRDHQCTPDKSRHRHDCPAELLDHRRESSGDAADQPRAEECHRREPARPTNLIRYLYPPKLGLEKIIIVHQALIVASFAASHSRQRDVSARSSSMIEMHDVSEFAVTKR